MSAELNIPDLLEIWKRSEQNPFIVTYWRPLNYLPKSTYEYKFTVLENVEEVKHIQEKQNCNCELSIRKILTSEGGTNQINQEVVNEFQLVYSTPFRYLLVCERLNKIKPLMTTIVLSCEYRARRNAWVIVGSTNDLYQLFTLNSFGEGFGLWSFMFGAETRVEFQPDSSEMNISIKYGAIPLFEAKLEDGTCLNQEEMLRRRIQTDKNVVDQKQSGSKIMTRQNDGLRQDINRQDTMKQDGGRQDIRPMRRSNSSSFDESLAPTIKQTVANAKENNQQLVDLTEFVQRASNISLSNVSLAK